MVWLRGCPTSTLRNLLLIQVPREFSTSTSKKDNYTAEQKQLILNRLNSNSPPHVLPKKLSQALKDRLDKSGAFNSLEQLLELPGLGPKSLRNICDKILNNDDEAPVKSTTKTRRPATSVPIVDSNKKVTSLVSVFVDSGATSWAKLNVENKSVLDWEFQTFEQQEYMELSPLLQKAVSLEKLLPEGDLYVIEENNKPSYAKGDSRALCLACMLYTVVHLKRDVENTGKIVFIKSRLVDKHFNAIVGNETVSLQPIVEDMIHDVNASNERGERSNRFSRFHIGPPLAAFMKRKSPYEKELLSRAALIGVCLADLCLLRSQK